MISREWFIPLSLLLILLSPLLYWHQSSPPTLPQPVPVEIATTMPRLRVDPLVGMAGQHATVTVSGLQTPARSTWRWAQLTVESPDGAIPVNSLWEVPAGPQVRSWILTGNGITVITLTLYTHNINVIDWRTEVLVETFSETVTLVRSLRARE